MLKLLGVSPKSICIKDAGEHSAVHYAALNPQLDVYNLMYRTLSSVVSGECDICRLMLMTPIL